MIVGVGCWYILREVYQYGRKIVNIVKEMAEYLNVVQMKKLQEVLLRIFSEKEIISDEVIEQFRDQCNCMRDLG